MFPLRRAALRAFSLSSTSLRTASCAPSSRLLSTAPRTVARPSISIISQWKSRRAYATGQSDDQVVAEQELAADTQTSERIAQNVGEVDANEEISPATPLAAEDASPFQNINETVHSEGTDTLAAGDRERRTPRKMEGSPSHSIYVGNLYFGVSEDSLAQEFSSVGRVTSSTIIRDPNGLSKGYGYLEFENKAQAAQAIADFEGHTIGGRTVTVQYATRPRMTPPTNKPCPTLYIGNMSFDMTDKDLTELFSDVHNVSDVRVAIDKRTGMPRGFAHADFRTVEDAQAALKSLQHKMVLGRKLRVNYSSTTKPAKP